MKKTEAVKKAGSAYKLAQILGVTRQAVSKWGDTLPDLRVAELLKIRPEWFDKRFKR